MMTTNEMTEKENRYYEGSKVFVALAKGGEIHKLVEYVYLHNDPYINYVPSRSRLARNALSFFFTNNHIEAIKKFFQSPFAQDIEHKEVLDLLKNLTYEDKKEIFNIVSKHYQNKLTIDEKFDYLLTACTNGAYKIIDELIAEKVNFTQEEMMACCLAAIKSNPNKEIALPTLRYLEEKFPDLLYHQQDDILTYTAVKEKQTEVVHYLMYDKKLRITKHLNTLSCGNLDFAKIVARRKQYDSIKQKSINHKNKTGNTEVIKTKKMKI